jgi:hypothetical protein
VTPPDDRISLHRNVLDIQRVAAIKMIDRQIARDWAAGYGHDVDMLLDRRVRLMELLRTGPSS